MRAGVAGALLAPLLLAAVRHALRAGPEQDLAERRPRAPPRLARRLRGAVALLAGVGDRAAVVRVAPAAERLGVASAAVVLLVASHGISSRTGGVPLSGH